MNWYAAELVLYCVFGSWILYMFCQLNQAAIIKYEENQISRLGFHPKYLVWKYLWLNLMQKLVLDKISEKIGFLQEKKGSTLILLSTCEFWFARQSQTAPQELIPAKYGYNCGIVSAFVQKMIIKPLASYWDCRTWGIVNECMLCRYCL